MIKKYLSLLSILIIIYACATVQTPIGGEKDEKAPILYESNPKDQSTNFKGTQIKLFFNEWMKVEQLNNELIITPREDIDYEFTLKKQELIIDFEEPLQDSTTYTFNFRKALKDITEGNLWENPVIAFSTGNFLDSLKVEGTITKLMNQEPAKSYLVGLYNAKSDTANLRQGKPVYFTTTDENGSFKMQNLKAGKYILYSFEDKNDNLINNSESEPYGFHPDTLDLTDSIPSLSILTYKRNEDTLNLKKYSPVGKDFIVQYNKGLLEYKVTYPKDRSQHIYTNNVEKSKYLKIYQENFPQLEYETDSIELHIQVTDSINKSRLDTVYFKLRESRISNDDLKIESKPKENIISGNQIFIYKLSKPVYNINYDSIQLRLDTIPIKTFSKEEIKLNFNKKEIIINSIINEKEITLLIDSLKAVSNRIGSNNDSIPNKSDSTINQIDSLNSIETDLKGANRNGKGIQNRDPKRSSGQAFKENANVPRGNTLRNTNSYTLQLYTGKGAFIGIESDSTSSSTTKLTFMNPKDFGIIKGNVKGMDSNFIIELLSEKYEVIDTLINKNEYQFNYVKPGSYRIRVIKDENGNQKWDAGNPLKLKPTEKIYYLDEVITVKANWEVIDKNFDFSVDKSVNESGEN